MHTRDINILCSKYIYIYVDNQKHVVCEMSEHSRSAENLNDVSQ